jgi:alanine dehydrogenase
MMADLNLRSGLNIYEGQVTHPAVASALGLPHTPVESVVSSTPARRYTDVKV